MTTNLCTRGLPLSEHQRLNRFPASPLSAVSWIFEGETHLVSSSQIMPRLSFSGPQTNPILSFNPSAVYALTVGIYPDAWNALTVINISEYVDKTVPLGSIVNGDILAIFQKTFDIGPISQAISNFEKSLEIVWQKARPKGAMMPQTLQDWLYGLAAQSAIRVQERAYGKPKGGSKA